MVVPPCLCRLFFRIPFRENDFVHHKKMTIEIPPLSTVVPMLQMKSGTNSPPSRTHFAAEEYWSENCVHRIFKAFIGIRLIYGKRPFRGRASCTRLSKKSEIGCETQSSAVEHSLPLRRLRPQARFETNRRLQRLLRPR